MPGGPSTGAGFSEVILPVIWEQAPFIAKGGDEIVDQMWSFATKPRKDGSSTPVCLIPEATALIQELWDNGWNKSCPKPYRVFYITPCFRYETPQAGRQRQFTQIGAEILGGSGPEDREECIRTMLALADSFGVEHDYSVAWATTRSRASSWSAATSGPSGRSPAEAATPRALASPSGPSGSC